MKPSKPYRRTQIGYALLALALIAEISMVISCVKYRNPVACFLFSLVLVFLSACFFSLQVTVDETLIRLKFGIGIIRKEILLKQILSCARVKNFILSGWGVKRIGRTKGWSYNVSGFDAVELTLADGQRIKIGTDHPEDLLKAVNERIGRKGLRRESKRKS